MKNEEDKKNGPLKCEDIQAVLFDYMTRELGEGRSDLVREHIRKCRDCQNAAAEIQATLDLIHNASKSETGIPGQLSEKHRARLIRAYMHPVLDWVYVHHMLVSAVIMIIAIIAVLCAVKKLRVWYAEPSGPVYTITVGKGVEINIPEPWRSNVDDDEEEVRGPAAAKAKAGKQGSEVRGEEKE